MTDRLQIYSTVVAFQINMSTAQQAAGLFFHFLMYTYTYSGLNKYLDTFWTSHTHLQYKPNVHLHTNGA